MHDVELFQQALGLVEPWEVTGVEFDAEQRRLDLRIDFPRGARFPCPECGQADCAVKDTEEKTWRHLDFFQHQAYLTARVPRVVCPEHKVRQVQVPWARERSGFTLLFEALVMALVKEMPVASVAALMGEEDKRVWRIVHHYVDVAVEAQDLAETERVGIDETSSRRGQDYVSVFADLDERRAVFVTEGRDQGTVSQAIDAVRRVEAKQHQGLLKNTRYLWLKRPANLTDKQQDWLDELLTRPLQTVRAYELALRFDDFYELEDPDSAEEYLRRWIAEVNDSGLQPLIKFAQMLKDHWLGVMRWHHSRVSNGLLEGLNSLIQAAKRRARGYRTNRNYIAMIYLVAGKLNPGPAPA